MHKVFLSYLYPSKREASKEPFGGLDVCVPCVREQRSVWDAQCGQGQRVGSLMQQRERGCVASDCPCMV